MLSLRNRFGIPGVISVFALVFAMLGGAYAASNDGGSATASAKKKNLAKKGPRGPRGKPGKPGPAGPQGPAGPPGPAGAKGDTGAAGSNGSDGSDGATGPTGATGATGKGTTGPTGPTGVTGVTGTTGSPWTAGGTLPQGQTQTGSFATLVVGEAIAPISFPIPLASEVSIENVHKTDDAGFATACPGSASNPTVASNGHLCIYLTDPVQVPPPTITSVNKTGKSFEVNEGASTVGAFLYLSAEESFGYGTYAVKGP